MTILLRAIHPSLRIAGKACQAVAPLDSPPQDDHRSWEQVRWWIDCNGPQANQRSVRDRLPNWRLGRSLGSRVSWPPGRAGPVMFCAVTPYAANSFSQQGHGSGYATPPGPDGSTMVRPRG